MLVKISALVLALVALTPAACAQRSGDAAARRIVSTWTGERRATRAAITRYRSLAQRGCNQGQEMSGIEYGDCAVVMLALAEENLAAAAREYEAKINRLSDSVGEPNATHLEGEWRTIWAYSQRRWRESRDADCAAIGISAGGGSGVGTDITRCMAERTGERAAQVRAM